MQHTAIAAAGCDYFFRDPDPVSIRGFTKKDANCHRAEALRDPFAYDLPFELSKGQKDVKGQPLL
jgi:hypothetical protein